MLITCKAHDLCAAARAHANSPVPYSNKALISAYKSASIFVYPSLAERRSLVSRRSEYRGRVRGGGLSVQCFDNSSRRVTGLTFDHRAADAAQLSSQRV